MREEEDADIKTIIISCKVITFRGRDGERESIASGKKSRTNSCGGGWGGYGVNG